jgi:tetratricopeptide (TPR) repeat protein
VLRRIVDVYEMAGQPEKATPELEELHRRHSDDAAVVLRLAELAIVRRDYTAGLDYYKTLHKLEPDNQKAAKKLAETLLLAARKNIAEGRVNAAAPLFEESFRLEPPNDKINREYAGFLATTGRFDQAIALLKPLKDTDSRLQLAAVLEMQGDSKSSLRFLLDLEKEHPLDVKTQRSIARLLLANRQYEEALIRLSKLLNEKPADSQLQREYVDAVAASDKSSETMRQAMASVYRQYQNDNFKALDAVGFERFGDALRRLGMFDEARAVLDRAVGKYPTTRRLRFSLAQTLGSLGRYDDAEKQYGILLSSRPLRN